MTTCPSHTQLAGFHAGRLLDDTLALVESHLDDGCANCERVLDELDRRLEPMLGLVRRHPPAFLLEQGRATTSRASVVVDVLAPLPKMPAEKYDKLQELGRGGMGIVFRAWQVKANRVVALKMILASRYATTEDRIRFRIEAQTIAKLRHPNIVEVFDVDEHDGLPFFALEYVDGGTLATRLAKAPLRPVDAAAMVRKLASAMHFAHSRGVVHRDLKPANVLMTMDGEPKISDFGLAKILDQESELTRTDAVMGTPAYMSPEQAQGRTADVGPQTDVYALGVVLYECLTGAAPFCGKSSYDILEKVKTEEPAPPSRRRPKIPRDLETICLKCLQKEPGARYGTAQELADDLTRFLNKEPVHARPVGSLERTWRWCRRNPLVAQLLAGIVLVLLLGSGAATFFGIHASLNARRAEDNARIATENERRALQGERDANYAREQLQVEAYFDKIAAAHAEWNAGNLPSMAHLLEDCPEALRQWEWHYLNRLCWHAKASCSPQSNRATGVCFSPDGSRLASCGSNITISDVQSGRTVATSKAQDSCYCSVWSPDGKNLAAGRFVSVVLFDPATLEPKRILDGHQKPISSVAFNGSGQFLASGSEDGAIKIWDVETGTQRWQLLDQGNEIRCLCFDPADRWLASATREEKIIIWDLGTGRQARTLGPLAHPVSALAVTPDGKQLISASRSREIRAFGSGKLVVWNPRTGNKLKELSVGNDHYNWLAVSPDGQQLAAACSEGRVKRWRLEDWSELSSILLHSDPNVLAYSKDSRLLATAETSGAVQIWDANLGQESRNLREGQTTSVFAFATDGAGEQVAVGDGKGNVSLLDVVDGKCREHWVIPDSFALALALDQKSEALAIGCADSKLLLWRRGWAEPRNLPGHEHRVYGVGFSPDGQRLWSASQDTTIRVSDAMAGTALATFPASAKGVRGLAIDAIGGRVATFGEDHCIHCWDQQCQAVFSWPSTEQSSPTCLSFSPDGELLAAGGPRLDPKVRIWDVQSGELKSSCVAHRDKITCVAFSPDGKRLATTSDDGAVILWEPLSGRRLLALPKHKGGATGAAFVSHGEILLTTGWDGVVRVLDAAPLQKPGTK